MARRKRRKRKILKALLAQGPHNGRRCKHEPLALCTKAELAEHEAECHPDRPNPVPITNRRGETRYETLQIWDEASKSFIGGQVLSITMALRHRRCVMTWGRRGGKSTGVQYLFVEEQGRTPGQYTAGYIAQDHAKAKEMFEIFLRNMGGDPRINTASWVKAYHRSEGQDRWIELKPIVPLGPDGQPLEDDPDRQNTGGKYYFWSGQKPNYENLRGYQFPFHRIVVDESAFINKECTSDILLKMLTDVGGHFLAVGTPKAGKVGQSWFETFFQWGQDDDPKHKDWYSVAFPQEVNPCIKLEFQALSRAETLTEEEEWQECDARFLSNMGAVYRNLDNVFVLAPVEGEPSWLTAAKRETPASYRAWFSDKSIDRLARYVIGVDWAKKRDHSVISIFRTDTLEQVGVVHFHTGNDYEDIIRYVKAAHEAYNGAVIHSDTNGVGESMTERLARKYGEGVIGHRFSYQNKGKYVRRMQMLFEGEEIKMLNVVSQREEFRKYAILNSDNAHALEKFGHPEGVDEHDDFHDAAVMCGESLSLGPQRRKDPPKPKPPYGSAAWFKEQMRKKRRSRRRSEGVI